MTSEAGSFGEVLKLVKKKWPGAPLVVATLLKPEMALKSLGRELDAVFPGQRIGFPGGGQAVDILLVRPDDLKTAETERAFQWFLQ